MSVLSGYSVPAGPVFFIVGAPRAGTTLLLQTIINHFAIAYINNLVAKFWEAPVIGAAFSQSILGTGKPVAYESSGGFTEGILGPHEFGYFWKRFFHYGESNVIPIKQYVAG